MSDKLSDKMDTLYGGYAKTIAKQNLRIADLERQLADEQRFVKAARAMAMFSRSMRDMKFPLQPVELAFLAAFDDYEARKPK